MDDRKSAAALRDELLLSVGRWRASLLTAADEPGSTMWFGVGERAIAITNSLIRVVVDTLWPEEPLPRRPLLGHRIGIIERRGQKSSTACALPRRRLLTKADVGAIHRFSTIRKAFAHQEDQGLDAELVGRPTPSRVAEILDIAEAIAGSSMVDETICVEARREA